MAAHHFPIHQTTAGAPDAIVDWFALFQNWITGTVGWTVVAGGGTTDLVLRSLGEAGGYTMLFVHIWRVGVGNTVRIEVSDDAIPTHETNEGGTLDSGGANPFTFWMSANKEMIIVCWASGAGCRYISAGALMPFALNPPDETYHIVATSGQATASILRASTGVWDVDINNTYDDLSDNAVIDNLTGTFPLFGIIANRNNLVAGQYHLQSGWISPASVPHGTTLDTVDAGGSSSWIVLNDVVSTHNFALWTGGVIPTGDPDGAWFGSSAGNAATPQILLDAFAAQAVACGWTDHGDPGYPLLVAPDINRLIHSVGEDGTSDIWVYLSYDATGAQNFRLTADTDGALTHYGNAEQPWQAAHWPANYIISGDRDMMVVAVQEGDANDYYGMCLGKAFEAAPWINPYSGVVVTKISPHAHDGDVLESHRVPGNWGTTVVVNEQPGQLINMNPNAYDGTTYLVYPMVIREGWHIIGSPKYAMCTSGGGIAQGDTITCGAKVYTVLSYWTGFGYFWALRTT